MLVLNLTTLSSSPPQGFVVGFSGSKIFCLHFFSMSSIDVPQVSHGAHTHTLTPATCCYTVTLTHSHMLTPATCCYTVTLTHSHMLTPATCCYTITLTHSHIVTPATCCYTVTLTHSHIVTPNCQHHIYHIALNFRRSLICNLIFVHHLPLSAPTCQLRCYATSHS